MKKHNGLTVFCAVVAIINIFTKTPVGAVAWGYLSYCAYKGHIYAMRNVVRLMLAAVTVVLTLGILVIDLDTIRQIGFSSRGELLAVAILGILSLLGFSAFLSEQLKISLAEFIFARAQVDVPPINLQIEQGSHGKIVRNPAHSPTTNPTEQVYSKALDEFHSDVKNKELYARLVAECDGNEDMVRARYVAARARELIAESESNSLRNESSSLRAIQPDSAATAKKRDTNSSVDNLHEDIACLKDYRFRVLESGVMRLYELESGKFALKRGSEVYVYLDLESARAAYADDRGIRQAYIRDAVGWFSSDELTRR